MFWDFDLSAYIVRCFWVQESLKLDFLVKLDFESKILKCVYFVLCFMSLHAKF